jgi:hypothetical protein
MPVLMVRCPNTGRKMSTGLDLDADTFASLPDKLITSSCPACGVEHSWLKCDARYVGEKMPASAKLSTLLLKLDRLTHPGHNH